MPTTTPTASPNVPPPQVPRAPLRIGILVYPGVTLLDLAGPQQVLGVHGQTHLVWKSREPVTSDTGVAIVPTATFAECPADLDVLFVPGSSNPAGVMEDAEALAFLAERAPGAAYVTAVCTGALVLAAAGLLDGYRAATHWVTRDVLAAFGVEVGTERVVVDRNRITGGGVTAGIDFGLTLLAHLRGEMTAQFTQLAIEYDPQPPFDVGSPEAAGPALVAAVRSAFNPANHARMLRVADAYRAGTPPAP